MRIRPALLLSVCAMAGVSSFVVAPPGLASDADTQPSTAETVAHGSITGAQEVVVRAAIQPVTSPSASSPQTGDLVDLLPVAPADVVVEGDNYRVALDPADVPSTHITDTGLVTLSIGFTDTETGKVSDQIVSARAVRGSRSAGATQPIWVDPLAEVSTESAGAVPRLQGTGDTSADAGVLTATSAAPVEAVDVRLRDAPRSQARIEAATAEISSFPGGTCYWGDRKRVWATVGTSYPVNLATLSYSNSTSSTFGAGVTYGNGWSASGTKTTEDSWGQNFNRSGRNRSYQVAVVYRRQNCYLASAGTYSHSHTIPEYQPGFSRVNLLGSAPDYRRYCGPVASGEWWRGGTRGTDYQLSYGVKVKDYIGIDLSSRRAYSSAGRLSYFYGKARRMCGSNSAPSTARTVRERYRR